MTTPTCGACRFYHEVSIHPDLSPPEGTTFGECRVAGPSLAVGSERTTPGYARIITAEWPRLPSTEWCGRYEKKEVWGCPPGKIDLGGVVWPEETLRQVLQRFAKDPRSWPDIIGPEPGQPGCRVPERFLQEAANK